MYINTPTHLHAYTPTHSLINTSNVQRNPSLPHHIDPIYRILTKNYYVALHAWILVYPFGLVCDWSSGAIDSITSLSDPRIFQILAMYFVVVCL